MPSVQLPAVTLNRKAWNKGRTTGQKRPLFPNLCGLSARVLKLQVIFVTLRCSTLRWTASCEAMISSHSP
ncbi:hypothetical protein C8N36_12038 [Pelagimonas varians]|uniref:Uncharacterized protein n=1 Tax=Pelagimonas varians TaxID=696760 RepID=A0A238L2M3_9RHOB|nr:hypothetical protein C8N36_12038 [Pelagimonas varians]SMX49100.1 hypothetical protein PEV8663_04093 [Pelagimonas varians]